MQEFDAKVILLGDTTVGKSSIILQFTENTFKEFLPNTIGTAFTTKIFEREKGILKLHIWDTCGQERFMGIANIYYKDANVILLVVDCSNEQSLYQAEDYLEKIYEHTKNPRIILLINKVDLLEDYEPGIDLTEEVFESCEFYSSILAFKEQNSLEMFWVSAKDNINIQSTFNYIVENIFNGSIYIEKMKNQIKGKKLLSLSMKKQRNNSTCC